MCKENNSHLALVFQQILPAIDKAGFKYWVYGGIGVAGVVGKFIRHNNDIDIYVLDEDFDRIKQQLTTLCEQQSGWQVKEARPLGTSRRPKIEIYVDGEERLSVVPVYKTQRGVEFRANTLVILPPDQALRQESKKIQDYDFFTPPRAIIKAILWSLIIERPRLLKTSRRSSDARAVFTEEEFRELERLTKAVTLQ